VGYSKDGSITDFWPDDTDTEMYLDYGTSLSTIMERIKEKWPDATNDQIEISAEHIHTSCLYYDQYDPSDYTNFVVIKRNS